MIYTLEKTLQMNTPLVDTDNNISIIQDDVKYTNENRKGIIEMRYVIKQQLSNDLVWENGEVKGAYFVDEDFYNLKKDEHKLVDLSKEYATQNLITGASLYGYKNGYNTLNNIKGTTSFLVRDMNSDKLFKMLSVGSYLRFENTFKTFRIEEKTPEGLMLSYTFKDANGNISTVFEFKPKEYLKQGVKNKVFNLFIPNVQTNSINNFKNQRESISKKHEQKVSDRDRVELLSEISSYLNEKFDIPVIVGTSYDFGQNEELSRVKKIIFG